MTSKIYKELTKTELNKISKDFYGNQAKLCEYRILKGGLFNTTYFLKTNKDSTGIVLRVAPINKHLLFDFEKDMMAAEPLFHTLLEKNQIPTSQILKYMPTNTIIEREYIISRFIPAIPMNDPSLEGINLDYLYEEAGRLTKKLHTITNDHFGWKRPHGRSEYNTWADFITVFAEEASKKALEYTLFEEIHINFISSSSSHWYARTKGNSHSTHGAY